MPKLKFKTTLEPRGPAAAVLLTDEQVADVGEGAKVFPVKATINGYTWAGRVARMRGENMLGLTKATRAAAKVEAGDIVEIVVELDDKPREVEIPKALADAFKTDKAANQKYDALAFTHRKEFARWIADAKKEETRDRRLAKTLEMLHENKTIS